MPARNKTTCIRRDDVYHRFYHEDEVDCNEDEVEEESDRAGICSICTEPIILVL